jgi:uncharacterized protein (TIGR00369 family)
MESSSEKIKIYNPYNKMAGHNCFACSNGNPVGLKMEFYEQGEYIACKWEPKIHFGGYENILHGGIQATMQDEIASWTIQVKHKTAGVTTNMNVRYKKPVYVDKGKLLLRAKISEVRHQIVTVKTELFNAHGELASEAEINYFCFSEKVAREKLHYPGSESFYKK